MNVPFVDLPLQYQHLRQDIDRAVLAVMSKCNFILGQEVTDFERDFAAFVGAKHCVAVGSGTDALQLILRALGIGPGDEVITVANTFIATVEAITYVGATPVLVDAEAGNYLIDPEGVRRAITPKTRAVIPVHLYGQPANIDPILAIAKEHRVHVVEDAAQAHGASWRDGRRCGTVGVAAGFSFYPGKNLGAYGDGGAITTNDLAVAEKIKLLRNWGSVVKYHHEIKGYNSRLDTMQAAVLLAKLPHLAAWNEARNRVAAQYRAKLADVPGVVLPEEAPWTGQHVYHLFVVRILGKNRDLIMKGLGEKGIQSGIHYPKPVHLQNAYQDLGLGRGAFPVSELVADDIVSLPMFPEMTDAQVDHVVATLRDLVT